MTDRNFILMPKTITVEFEVNQTFALLNSLSMLSEIREYPGVDGWLLDLERQLPDEVKRENEVLIEVFYPVLFQQQHYPATLLEFAEKVAHQSLDEVYKQVSDGLVGEKMQAKHPNVTFPSMNDLLAHPTAFINHFHRLEEEYGHENKRSVAILQEMYHLITHLEELPARIRQHFGYLWEHHLQAEWGRVEPMLQETANHFRRIPYDNMTRQEIIHTVTGRDMSGTWILDQADVSSRITFYPVPHIGPYVAAIHREEWLNIAFRPHLPEGIKPTSQALNRSELLVRLAALADDSRLQILELFTRHTELCAQDVIILLNLSQSAASRHLRQLTATGFLAERRRDGNKCYRLNAERMTSTLESIRTFLSLP